jgi:hypothetical protein
VFCDSDVSRTPARVATRAGFSSALTVRADFAAARRTSVPGAPRSTSTCSSANSRCSLISFRTRLAMTHLRWGAAEQHLQRTAYRAKGWEASRSVLRTSKRPVHESPWAEPRGDYVIKVSPAGVTADSETVSRVASGLSETARPITLPKVRREGRWEPVYFCMTFVTLRAIRTRGPARDEAITSATKGVGGQPWRSTRRVRIPVQSP